MHILDFLTQKWKASWAQWVISGEALIFLTPNSAFGISEESTSRGNQEDMGDDLNSMFNKIYLKMAIILSMPLRVVFKLSIYLNL